MVITQNPQPYIWVCSLHIMHICLWQFLMYINLVLHNLKSKILPGGGGNFSHYVGIQVLCHGFEVHFLHLRYIDEWVIGTNQCLQIGKKRCFLKIWPIKHPIWAKFYVFCVNMVQRSVSKSQFSVFFSCFLWLFILCFRPLVTFIFTCLRVSSPQVFLAFWWCPQYHFASHFDVLICLCVILILILKYLEKVEIAKSLWHIPIQLKVVRKDVSGK